jgi:hypothetical protein
MSLEAESEEIPGDSEYVRPPSSPILPIRLLIVVRIVVRCIVFTFNSYGAKVIAFMVMTTG